ncbi:RNA polymerase subunit sigma-70 [Flavobacteriales bacterium 33_180_T64]|nr:RNA polymerase subunit sigma-70 [Flavobacteriales bacterium 33_180_T64]
MQLETLIYQFQNKNEKAFEQLYTMYSDSMLGVIYNIVRDHDMAEELMQDVFIKAWNNSSSYNSSKGRFFTWILNIARHAAIDKTRSKAYKNATKNLNAEFFVDILETSDNLNDQVDAIGIDKYVKALGEKCKKIIEFLYFKGYTQKETAEALEVPIGTIKTRNRNCIKDLRAIVLK